MRHLKRTLALGVLVTCSTLPVIAEPRIAESLIAEPLIAEPLIAQECESPLEQLLARVPQLLSQHETWRAEFTQENHLAALQAPLMSEGVVCVVVEKGLVWQVTSPIQSSVTLNNEGVDLGDGIDTGSKLTASLLQNVLQANFVPLQDQFEIAGCLEEDRWQLRLEPKQTFLAERILAIEIAGTRAVERLVLKQPGNNHLEIYFHPPQELPELPQEVLKALEHG